MATERVAGQTRGMTLSLPSEYRSLAILVFVSLTAVERPAQRHEAVQPVASTPDAPAPSHLEAIAFDATRRRLVLFGGSRLTDTTWADLNETWEWDGHRWYAIPTMNGVPGARRAHALAYDPGDRRVVLVGGRDDASRNTLGDAWTWDGSRWSALSRGTTRPEPRASAGLVADADSGRLLLYGGVAPPRGMVADLWVWSQSDWAQLHPAGESTSQGTGPAFTAAPGAFIGVSVADLEASVRWYSEKLGLKVVMRPPKYEKSMAVILEGGGLIVELMHNEDAVPLSQAAPAITRNYLVHGIFKAGVVVQDFDKTIANLKARGIPIVIGPFPATAEQRANAIIRDNAGNYIQFFGARRD